MVKLNLFMLGEGKQILTNRESYGRILRRVGLKRSGGILVMLGRVLEVRKEVGFGSEVDDTTNRWEDMKWGFSHKLFNVTSLSSPETCFSRAIVTTSLRRLTVGCIRLHSW